MKKRGLVCGFQKERNDASRKAKSRRMGVFNSGSAYDCDNEFLSHGEGVYDIPPKGNRREYEIYRFQQLSENSCR